MEVMIRPESFGDCAGIREVHLAAFAQQPFSQQTEHRIVDGLREDGALALSLVAEKSSRVVGHIAFSRVTIDGKDLNWFALGPVGVSPLLQGQGIGSSRVRQGLESLRQLGAEGCVLVGEPAYYGRFGFRPCTGLTIEGFPAEAVLCLRLAGSEPRGRVEHHRAFWVQASETQAPTSLSPRQAG